MATETYTPDLSASDIAAGDAAVEEANSMLAAEEALAKSKAKLAAMADAAYASAQESAAMEDYSVHEVAGIGRYAVVRKTGWIPLLDVIHTPTANIDFSVKDYPGFDAVIGQHFQSPHLLDPLDERYDPLLPIGVNYKNLRDNIAAVRNFLMETYYVNTPKGMTPEKAQKALAEIAAYIGDGFNNNYLFLGLIPNHNPNKHSISLLEASASGGAGAQYIYEKVLAMHRQSSWLRPFSAVAALFGGKPAPDWMLPPASQTEFTDILHEDIVAAHGPQGASSPAPTQSELEAGIAQVTALEAARQKLVERQHLNASATDLDHLGDHLLQSAANLQDIAKLTEPVKREAIDIAKDILRKLKVSLGSVNILDGLKLPPMDDLATFGGMKGVVMVYERMLGYGRALDPRILQDPTVLAATRAIGQMGYLAKLEALRFARMAGNIPMAEMLSGQVAKIATVYASAPDATFGGLLDKVERGIDTLLSRSQTIGGPGAHVGFTPGKEIGSSITVPPTAGMAQQISNQQHAQSAAQRNANVLAAETAQTQALTRGQDPASRPKAEVKPPPTAPRGAGLRALVQPGRAARGTPVSAPSSTTTTSPAAAANAPQRQQQRMNMLHHAQEEEEHEHQLKQQQQLRDMQLRQLTAAKKSAAKAAVQKIDAKTLDALRHATDAHHLHGEPVNPGFKPKHFESLVDTKKGSAVKPPAPGTPIDEQNRSLPPGPKGPSGRGF